MFPQMNDVLSGFGRRFQFARVIKTAVDYETVETKADVVWSTGVLQPLSPQALRIKPEGQRQWKFWDLWTKESLMNDDEIVDKCNKKFRVMSRQDWSEAGYYRYEITEMPR